MYVLRQKCKIMPEGKGAYVLKEYKHHSCIAKYAEEYSGELYMPVLYMPFCSLSDDVIPQYDGEVDMVCSLPGELNEDDNVEYNRNASVCIKKFEKESVKVTDFLRSCNYTCLKPWNTLTQMSKDSEQENISGSDKKAVSVPSKNLYSSTTTETCPEALAQKAYYSGAPDLRNYLEKQQFFKYFRCLVYKGSIHTPDSCDIPSDRHKNDESKHDHVSTTNCLTETTNQFTDECTCDAIQETFTSYCTADESYHDLLSEHHSNSRPLHSV